MRFTGEPMFKKQSLFRYNSVIVLLINNHVHRHEYDKPCYKIYCFVVVSTRTKQKQKTAPIPYQCTEKKIIIVNVSDDSGV